MSDGPGENELWTVAEAATYWGVTESRARAILAKRGIKRVSGYPADRIQAVELRQGARTDLHEGTAVVEGSTQSPTITRLTQPAEKSASI
ncbi:hypothetical protein ACPXCO_23195 [Streptomyces cyaneofuscatus]|uniref:hypothetical protein n=1 Tax=Streptomyces cyaneofuscatus TaxID=66883 RepID=UPI003CED3DAB